MKPAPAKRYPVPCPVCRIAMIGEKREPDDTTWARHRCFNCGAVIELAGGGREEPDDDGAGA